MLLAIIATRSLPLVIAPIPEAPTTHPADYTLDWTAPTTCPDEAAIREEIDAKLPSEPGGQGTLGVVGEITQTDAGYDLVLETRWGEKYSEARVSSPVCDDLAVGATTIVVLSIVPSWEAPEVESEELDIPPRPPIEEEVPRRDSAPREAVAQEPLEPAFAPQQPRPEPASDRRQRLSRPRISLSLGAGPEYGALRNTTAAVEVRAGLRWERASVELHGVYLTPREAPPAAAGRVQLGGAGARGCWWPVNRRWGWSVCGGAEAGGLRFASLDPAGRDTTGPWFGPLASSSAHLSLGRVGVFAGAEAVVRAVGTRVTRLSTGVFRPRIVSVRAVAGLRFEFR